MSKTVKLQKYETYTRKEVHDILEPHTNFTPGTGSWGLQGIIRLKKRENDFVFFVTYGQSQAGHEFDEAITESGILTWQSQPKQELHHPMIKKLINHNHHIDNIYLFLRPNKNTEYIYLGKLAYITHDKEREKPVYFKWQILDWELSQNQANKLGIELELVTNEFSQSNENNVKKPVKTSPPSPNQNCNTGKSTRQFHGHKVDFAENNARNKKIGLEGEKFILKYEKEFLIRNDRKDLAEKVIHTSQVKGDGTGYDIQSYTLDGEDKFIEVKTTTGGKNTAFDITLNEVAFSELHPDNYYLYRVFNFDFETKKGQFYEQSGSIRDNFDLEPVSFKANK
ncbi:DUF3427 domain-containing protein [Sporohalobacter salinus]|uniref:DUF3427 domain-containing protein n=1 Tax=Sporohalobacter salinus TaxID=1494606 RepID=UPI00195F4A37|nr:DUF3427 domain-containing protein [Sporohalobacter salinus]MBM7623762.1 hypothetical protein [Sporohalobacter salinus]